MDDHIIAPSERTQTGRLRYMQALNLKSKPKAPRASRPTSFIGGLGYICSSYVSQFGADGYFLTFIVGSPNNIHV